MIEDHPIGTAENPAAMQSGSIYLWFVLLAIYLVHTWRTGRLSVWALFFIAGTLSFWQEFFGDWGGYVAWNPAFERLPFWGDMPYTTPVKPLFIPFSWGWFYSIAVPPLLLLVDWICRVRPNVSRWLVALVIAGPLFYLYDVVVEVNATAKGWWTYAHTMGPAASGPNGTYPLTYPPMLLGPWAALMIAMFARNAAGIPWWERWANLDELPAGAAKEIRRLIVFVLIFNVTFFLTNTGPIIVMRLLFGVPSSLVP